MWYEKVFKSLAILLLALLSILIISTIILRHYFPPERIKALILAEAEKATGRKVLSEKSGSASFTG